jgi:formylglycine-generating enzyme required for sulfatase activity
MKRLSIALLLLLAAIPLLAQETPRPAQETPRPAALLLSNWRYRHLAPLLTPETDVAEMQRVLESLDPPYEVTVVTNETSKGMGKAVEAFAKRHAGNPVVLVYASGHGLQVGGFNYLAGIDVDMTLFETRTRELRRIFPNEDDARDHLLGVDGMIATLGTMSPAEAGDEHVKMVFVDACREPFPEVADDSLASTKSVFGGKSAGGLARVTERPGVFVGMSAAANQVAQQNDRELLRIRPALAPALGTKGFAPFLWEHFGKGGRAADLVDGELPPSFFTQRLAGEIAKGGSLEEVFNRAGAAVRRDSEKLVRESRMQVVQTPAKYSLYYGSYAFGHHAISRPQPVTLADRLRAATRNAPFVNSLGLEFVPVPGLEGVWMCRTETRVRDFRAFAKATDFVQQGGAFVGTQVKTENGKPITLWGQNLSATWEDPGFDQTEDHPVVCVSWEDAQAFCAWLSREEPSLVYRLPKDAEWSAALGALGEYPWGNEWPPPVWAGNYQKNWSGLEADYDDDDGAERTARVGSSKENRFGFFDLGGNVSEWCEDEYLASMNDADVLEMFPFKGEEKNEEGISYRIERGGSFRDTYEAFLRSSYRAGGPPTSRSYDCGFRLVVAVGVGG